MTTLTGNFVGGTAATRTFGASMYVMFSIASTWADRNEWTLSISSTSGNYVFGKTSLTNMPITHAITLNDRVHFVGSNQWVGSAIDDFTQYGVSAPSAFTIELRNAMSGPAGYCGLASYQGRMAVFAPQSVQLWSINADPDLFQKQQDFSNTGTAYPLTLQALGMLDVVYLHSSGVKTLKVREQTLNASVVDVGTPIDSLVVSALENVENNPCAIVDPLTGNYWLTIDGTVYVFSYYPALKISAWSTFELTSGDQFFPEIQVPFNVSKFVVAPDNSIVALGSDSLAPTALFYYEDYDNCELEIETAWMDMKAAGDFKHIYAFNAVCTADLTASLVGESTKFTDWKFYVGGDPWSGKLDLALDMSQFKNLSQPAAIPYGVQIEGNRTTFDTGRIPLSIQGTHIKFRAVTDEARAVTLSAFYLHVNKEGENIYA